MGHFSSKCEEPKKSKEQKSPVKSDSKKEGTLVAAVDSSSDDKGTWAADEIEDDGADWFEEVVGTLKPDGGDKEESDWFEEAVAEEDLEMLGKSPSGLNLGSFGDELRACVLDNVVDDLPELLPLLHSEDEDSDIEEKFSNWEKEGVSVEDLFDTLGEAFVVAQSSSGKRGQSGRKATPKVAEAH
jgi:hypothetical protein